MLLSDHHIKSELTRYISGECTPEESSVIMSRIEMDGNYNTLYKELSGAWNLTLPSEMDHTFNVDQAWEVLNSRIDSLPATRKVITHAVSKKRIVPVRALYNVVKVAAVLLIGIVIFQLVVNRNPLKTVSSDINSVVPVKLADGSGIFLNSGSSVKFPERFAGTNREVYFCGEAFFEIAPDPAHPFIIEAGETRVKVLGTSFNLKAYPETNTIEVVVNSGRVLFYHVDENDKVLGEVELNKGEKGVFNRNTGKIARLLNDEPNYLSWKTGILVFHGTTLDQVFSIIGKKYNVHFNVNNKDLCQLKLTATFDNESLDAVLEVLKLVHNLQIVNNGKDYLVEKKAG